MKKIDLTIAALGLALDAIAAALVRAARKIKGAFPRMLEAIPECPSVGMTRLNLTLAQMHNEQPEKVAAFRPDMRAQGHGAVFNDLPDELRASNT